MDKITDISFKGYKLFPKDEYTSMNNVSRVNVIIGKNNSGKTSLLDIIESVYDEQATVLPGVDIDNVNFIRPLEIEMADKVFSGGLISCGSWNRSKLQNYMQGKLFTFRIKEKDNVEFYGEPFKGLGGHKRAIAFSISEKRSQYRFRKITAERNINPEKETEIGLHSNGEGATNLIRTFINDSKHDETIIESKLLSALNTIMMPDAEYESIRVQQINQYGENYWEVFLKEKGLQRVPLSKMGSGLKTVVLVLLNLLVVPLIKEYKDYKIVYGFEELENNLHPALQRRLFDYVYDFAERKKIIIYLTTHSHIAINAFFDKENTTIYHVVKENGIAQVKNIETHIDKTEILDDLDVKASDLLQSNGIIWVEGPSDRIYISRWFEIFTDNKFIEGKDYQFLYYGGRLLSQYSTNAENELINIITINRNAAIVMDSDKKYKNAPLNGTKKRIIHEFQNLDMFYWVTKGKEIENYIPKEAVDKMNVTDSKKACGQYDLFPQYIEKYYTNFTGKKFPFANQIKQYITYENSKDMLDLKIQILKLYEQIQKWNT